MRKDPKNFFTVGRVISSTFFCDISMLSCPKVFMCLWSEPVGETPTEFKRPEDQKKFRENWLGGSVYSNTQRFVVVRPRYGQHFSMCLLIKTYVGKGAAEFKSDAHAYAIIYVGRNPPNKLPLEPELTKQPIRMIPVDETEQLSVASRLNFGKPTPVEHNLRVKHIGHLDQQHIYRLVRYYEQESVVPSSPAGGVALGSSRRGSTSAYTGELLSSSISGEERGGMNSQSTAGGRTSSSHGLSRDHVPNDLQREFQELSVRDRSNALPAPSSITIRPAKERAYTQHRSESDALDPVSFREPRGRKDSGRHRPRR
jgi:hypothetical protein